MKDNRALIAALVIVVIAILGYLFLTQPDRRTTGERVGDAVEQLSDGVGDAGRELQDRTPAERLRDNAEEMKEDLRR
ncbi:MAG: hypothetical protein AB7G80_01500 [Dongiaceae bacterium]